MKLKQLVLKHRSCRHYDAGHSLTLPALARLVELARRTLKYVLCCQPAPKNRIFETLRWAADLPDWPGPGSSERLRELVHAWHGLRRQDPSCRAERRRRPSP